MFKKLKQKIGEGVANSPAASPIAKLTQGKIGGQSKGEPQELNQNHSGSSTPPPHQGSENEPDTAVLVNLQEENGQSVDTSGLSADFQTAYSGSELDPSVAGPAELPVSFTSEHLTRSRTSSVSSEMSDASLFSPVSFPQRQYMLPSDVESASEFEDSASASGGTAAPTSVSKEELYQRYLKMQRRSEKFKVKLMQVISAYKELDREKEKLKTNLMQSQDKAFRRISELKEQIQLDLLAKQHIEDNYRLMLEEKDELTKVLKTQISLLKEGQQVPEDLLVKISEAEDKASENRVISSTPSNTPSKAGGDRAAPEEGSAALREKVKRLEILLNKCKETIKSNKERTQQLSGEKENITKQLESKEQETLHLKQQYKEGALKMQSQLNDARKQIEELEADKAMAIASAKQQMHETIEAKDQEISKVRETHITLMAEYDQLKEKAQSQLEKSRGIIKNLQEDKKSLTEEKNRIQEEIKEKIESSEQSIEADKEEMIQQLRRGKTQALALMQQQMDARIAELEKERAAALVNKDSEWKDKLAKEMELVEQQKQEELKRILSEKEEDMKLAIEERELQKMAALSQQDSASDHLKETLHQYQTKCTELETKMTNLQENHKETMQAYTQQIESNSKRHKESIEELSSKHQEQLCVMSEQHRRLLQERVEEVSQGYKQRIDELSQQYEEGSRLSSAEIDTAYQSQIADLKMMHENVARDQISQIDQFRKQASDLQKQNDGLQTELAEQMKQFESKVGELEKQLGEEREHNDKLKKESANLIQKHEKDRAELENRQTELTEQLASLKENLTQLSEENCKLVDQNKEKECALQEKINDMERESARLSSDVELKEKELLQKAEQYAEHLKMESVNHEKEMTRKLEEVQLQQNLSTSNVSDELGNKLSAANEQISSLEKKIQELVVRETELNNQLKNVKTEHTNQAHDLEKQLGNTKTEYDNRLSSANDKIHSLESTINDLIQKENQLNAELDEVRVDYETRMSMQSQEVTSLRGLVDNLKETEMKLTQQLQNTQKECDTLLAEAMEANSRGVTSLTEALESNQTELNSVVQELESTKSQVENFGNMRDELDSKTESIAMYEEKVCHLEEQVSKMSHLEQKLSTSQTELSEVTEHLKVIKNDLNEKEILLREKDASIEKMKQTVQELEQNVTVWKSAASEKEGSATELLANVTEKETQYLQLKEQMQEKISCLEGSLSDKEIQCSEFKEKAEKQDTLIEDIKGKLLVSEEKGQDLQNALSEANKKFQQLREEAKTKIKDYKSKLEEAERKVGEMENVLKTRDEEIEKEMADMKMKFELDRKDNELEHQADMKVLNDRLDKERENMKAFKENVKKQFDERHRQVKETIQNLREGFDETRKDDADITNKKLQRLEKQKDKEREEEVKTLKIRIEQMQAEHNTSLSSVSSEHEEEINVLKAEVESAKARVKDIKAQYNAEKEALEKHSEADKEEIGTQISNLQNQNAELSEQLKDFHLLSQQLDTERKRIVELEGQVMALKEEKEELQEQYKNNLSGLNEIKEKQDIEIQEKDNYISELEQKVQSLEQMSETIHQDYQSQLETIKKDHKSSIMEKAEELGENSATLSEQAKLIEEKETQLKKLQEKFVHLKQKAQSKCQDLIKDIEQKNVELLQIKETHQCEISSKVAEHTKRLLEVEEAHSAEKTMLESRMCQLADSDQELQGKLKELTDKLNSTEVELVEFTAHSQKTVEDLQAQLVSQKEKNESESVLYSEKYQVLEKQMSQNSNEMALSLQDKIKEYDLMVKERDSSLEILKQKVLEYEKTLMELEEKNKENLVANEKKWQDKLGELKQKYVIKLKEFQSQHESKLNEVQENSSVSGAENKKLMLDISRLETVITEKDQTIEGKEDELKQLSCKYESILQLSNSSHLQLEQIQEKTQKLENNVAVLETELKESESCRTELERKYEEIQVSKKQELEDMEKRLLEESNTKLVELKKKAELKLSQIKKQITGDKESVIVELSESNAKLRDQVSDLESQLISIKTEMEGNCIKLEELQIEQLNWEKEKKELALKQCQEMESHRVEYAALLESKENVLQEHTQKADSQQQTEASLKKEIGELKETIQLLTNERSDQKQKLENLQREVDQQIHDKDIDMRTLQMEQEKELETMKSEYQGRLEELEADHNSKIKQLVKELNLKVAEKEREFQDTFSDALDKSHRGDEKVLYEHRQEVDELHKDLQEKEQVMEQMLEDHQVQIQAMEEEHKADIASLNQQIEDLLQKMLEKDAEIEAEKNKLEEEITAKISKKFASRDRLHKEEIEGLSKEWHMERKNMPDSSVSPESDQSLVQQNQLALSAVRSGSGSGELLRQQVIELTQQLEELKMKHSMEMIDVQNQLEMGGGGLHKPLVPVGDEAPDQQEGGADHRTDLQMMNLQAQVIQQSGENAKLKIRERELCSDLESMRVRLTAMERGETPPASPFRHHSNSTGAGEALPSEPTELEYLRNILFQYMMGKETKTLSRVICTVMKFKPDETRKVVEREENKSAKFTLSSAFGLGSGSQNNGGGESLEPAYHPTWKSASPHTDPSMGYPPSKLPLSRSYQTTKPMPLKHPNQSNTTPTSCRKKSKALVPAPAFV